MSGEFEVSRLADIAFWLFAALAVGGSLLVVTVRDVFKAAVCLAASFLAVAAIYFLLQAEFIGVVQILVYVGAVSILIAFAVMIISNVSGGSRPARGRIAAATVAALVLAAVVFVVYNTSWTDISDISDEDAVAGLVGTYQETERVSAYGGNQERRIEAVDGATEDARSGVMIDSTGAIGVLLVREFVLPLEILGLLLVAALIGGLALMRDRRTEDQ